MTRGMTLLAVAVACAAWGCSGAKPTEATKETVEGLVTAKGQPVGPLLVAFYPEDPADPRRYDGAVQKDGRFSVSCPKGTYKVTLNPLPAGSGGDAAAGGLVGADPKALKEIATAYRSRATTKLTVDVPDGGKKDVTLDVR
jgi:hypothetical protein